MISLSNKKAYALFDRGATYTFVFERYRQLSKMKTKPLEMPSSISTQLKDVMVSTLVYENCEISIGERDQVRNLVVLTMHDFDAIIRMDWLRKQRISVDCYRKIIQFNPPKEPNFEFYGDETNPSMALIT